jgi:hypothetical protein
VDDQHLAADFADALQPLDWTVCGARKIMFRRLFDAASSTPASAKFAAQEDSGLQQRVSRKVNTPLIHFSLAAGAINPTKSSIGTNSISSLPESSIFTRREFETPNLQRFHGIDDQRGTFSLQIMSNVKESPLIKITLPFNRSTGNELRSIFTIR